MSNSPADSAADQATLRDYLRIFLVQWKVFLALIVLGGLAAYGAAKLQKPVYESTASSLVQSPSGGNMGMALAADQLAKSKAKYYVLIGQSKSVADIAAKSLPKENADSLLGRITVTNPNESPEVRVTAQGGTPEDAQKLANAWVKAMGIKVAEIEKPVAGADSTDPTAPKTGDENSVVRLEPTSPANKPAAPASPRTTLYILVGIALGILLGFVYSLLRHNLDRKIRSQAAVEKATGVSVVGSIPVDSRLKEQRRVVETGELDLTTTGGYAFAESLRELRTNLSYVNVDNPPRIIVVTSSVQSEGKSSITSNLAMTIAANGQKVTVVDGDLRRPVVAETFGLVSDVGLTDVLSGQAHLSEVTQTFDIDGNLRVVGSGPVPPNPSELLGSRAMSGVLEELSRDSIVLIDAPPLLPVTDSSVLTANADGALIVARAGSTDLDQLEHAVKTLRKINGNILGVILNRVPTRGIGASQYGYYGKYYYRQEVPDQDSSAKVRRRKKKGNRAGSSRVRG